MRSALWTPNQGKPKYQYRPRLNPQHPLNRSLFGWWLINDGAGSIRDILTGNKTGSATFNANRSVSYSYTNQLVADSPIIPSTLNDWTFSILCSGDASAIGTPFGNFNAYDGGFWFRSAADLVAICLPTDTLYWIISAAEQAKTHRWTATKSGTSYTLYLDGVLL